MLSGFQLKMLRIKKNVTQKQVADELNVTKNFISMVENQHRFFNEEQYQQYINAIYKHESDKKKTKSKSKKNTRKKAKKKIENIEK